MELWIEVIFTNPSTLTFENTTQDIAVSGTLSGTHLLTQDSDDSYESITEIESGGGPSTRHSYLEHKWVINLPATPPYEFNIEAYRTNSPDLDVFDFAYSTNDATYFNMLTVTKTTDDNTLQTAVIPDSVSGDVYIRVQDSDQTEGNSDLDTIYIDRMFVKAGTPPCEILLGFDHISTPSLVVSPEVPTAPGTPPTANAGIDQNGFVDYNCLFSGSGTTEPDGDVVTYQWDLTYDGSPVTLNGVGPSYLFQIPGTYVVTLTATDKDGSSTDTMWVNVSYVVHDIAVTAGWKLISYAVDTTGMNITEIFAGEWANIDSIMAYDNMEKKWLFYDAQNPPWLNTLDVLDHTMGFWINIISDGTLSVYGKVITSTTIDLYAGWNLVGYPCLMGDSVTNVLVGTGYDNVYKFDGLATYLIINMANFELMGDGNGYWVHVNADVSYVVDY